MPFARREFSAMDKISRAVAGPFARREFRVAVSEKEQTK